MALENTKLFQMLSEAQTTIGDHQQEIRNLQTALQEMENASQQEQQRRLIDMAVEEDVDELKGTLTELEKENKFVHEANSTMNSRYDLVIRRLRDENRSLKAEMEHVGSTQHHEHHAGVRKRQERIEQLEEEIYQSDLTASELRQRVAELEKINRLLQDEQIQPTPRSSLTRASTTRSPLQPLDEMENTRNVSTVTCHTPMVVLANLPAPKQFEDQ
jgi:predicted RNase H-like nuclease (RuvC/YqgF family)